MTAVLNLESALGFVPKPRRGVMIIEINNPIIPKPLKGGVFAAEYINGIGWKFFNKKGVNNFTPSGFDC
jgi:hypothetical protein